MDMSRIKLMKYLKDILRLHGRFRQGHVWTQFHRAREQVPQMQPANQQHFNGSQGFLLITPRQFYKATGNGPFSSMIYHDFPVYDR
jgi:hypothetical protein